MKSKKPTYKELEKRVLELETTLTKTQWLHEKENVDGTEPYVPFYGDVTKLNTERTILDSVGKESLKILTAELMDLLDTSVAIYEKNGDYAFGVFNSGWCQLLDASSRKLCNTDDNKTALNCGKWICHEDCWNNSAKAAILSKQPTDIDCVGGIKLYGEPIFVENEVIGVINIGYGHPPTDDKTLKELAENYHIDLNVLKEKAYAYNPRPNFIIEIAKKRLKSIAKLIGEIIGSKKIEEKLKESKIKYQSLVESSPVMILSHKLDGTITYINKNGAEFFNIAPKTLIGKNINTILNRKEEEYQNNLKLLLSKENKVNNTEEHYEINGKTKILEITSTPIIHENTIKEILIQVSDITERKLVENTLKENENKLKYIVENSTNVFYSHKADHKITYISPKIRDILGYQPNELMKEWTSFITDNPINEQGFKLTEKAIKTGKRQPTYLLELRHKSGKKVIVEAREIPIIENGEVTSIVGSLADVTKRINAEKALKESEEKYRNIFENAQDVFYEVAIDGTILELSPSIEILTKGQYKQKDLIGKSIYDYYSDPKDREELLSQLKKTGNVIDFEIIFKNRDGLLIPCSISSKIQFDTQGQPIKIIGSMRDIFDRKKAEEELIKAKEKAEESEDKFSIIFNMSSSLICVADINTATFKFINPSFEKILGYNKEELLSKPFLDFIHPDDVKPTIDVIEESLKAGIPIIYFENRYKRKDGNYRYLAWDSFPVPEKGITYAIAHDITEQKKTEQDLKKAKEKAEESDRLKSAFLANMSHEIRTPMNGILGFTELLKEVNLTGYEQRKYLDIIEKSGDRMLNTINDIIDFSRIESGEVELNIKTTNINTQLDSLHKFFMPEAQAKNISLICKLGFDSDSADIKIDPNKFDAIFINLIKNAIKFTHDGFIEFGYTLVDKNIHFYVKDTGVGIGSDKLEYIFERFIQEKDFDSSLKQGSGLGLSIVKAYVELMGGKIWVESTKGEGSTFYFTIPYQAVKKVSLTDKTDEKETKDKKNGFTNKTILIVEDDESSYEYLKVVVKSFGLDKIILAKNGEESIKVCKDNPAIDLVLMDINMPVMNGYEATKAIKALRPDLPIIAQTAYAIAGDREKSLQAGCDDYITKPVKKDKLLEVMEKFIK